MCSENPDKRQNGSGEERLFREWLGQNGEVRVRTAKRARVKENSRMWLVPYEAGQGRVSLAACAGWSGGEKAPRGDHLGGNLSTLTRWEGKPDGAQVYSSIHQLEKQVVGQAPWGGTGAGVRALDQPLSLIPIPTFY